MEAEVEASNVGECLRMLLFADQAKLCPSRAKLGHGSSNVGAMPSEAARSKHNPTFG
jgi:hypothetical protein